MNSPDGVILSYGADEHALAVLSVLPSAYRPLLLDVGREGVDFVTTLTDNGTLVLTARSGARRHLSGVRFWWNRRPRFRPQPGTEPPYANAQEVEVTHFWHGIFALQPGGHWCNPPRAHMAARNKVHQLFLARECGLRIPKTLWSNDPCAIREFWQSCGQRAVIKMFEGSERVWQPTRLLKADDLVDSDHLRFAHSIIQETIDGDREYRVVIFGDEVFAVASNVGRSRYPFDTRIDTATKREKALIPAKVLSALKEFRSRSGLSYCAFDIREDQLGEPVFLENNPMGQFLYMDRVFGGEVLRAFAAFMVSFGCGGEQENTITPEVPRWSGPVEVPHFVASGQLVSHIID